MGWARDLLGLPDRMERALIRAQHKAWGQDPNAFEQLQKITQEYRVEKFNNVVDKVGSDLVGVARWAFKPYQGIGQETQSLGQIVKNSGNTIAGFAMMLGGPMVAGAVKLFATAIGTGAEMIGIAQTKISEEANRVRWASPELRGQGVMAGIREMRTDLDIARQFGSQMALQEDQASRRESAYRLLTTKIAATMTKPFNQMNEAWTSTLEALSGQRDAADALVNLAAAVPVVGDWFKKDADRRNADFKEQMNMKDIQNGKKLCEDILGIILPGEIGIGEGGIQRPPKKQEMDAKFGAGDLDIGLKLLK